MSGSMSAAGYNDGMSEHICVYIVTMITIYICTYLQFCTDVFDCAGPTHPDSNRPCHEAR